MTTTSTKKKASPTTKPAAAPAAARRTAAALPADSHAGGDGNPASPWASAPLRERQREAKRQAVLQAAAQLFNEKGFHATSLDDIAARLHVSKPTLYYYVKNKDEILLQCVRQGLDMMLAGIEASRAAGGKAVDQLTTCMQVYARIVMQDFGMCLIRVGDEQVPPESRKELRRLKSAIDQEFRRLVAEGVQEGSLAPCDPKMTAFVIAGALSWIGRWYKPGGDYTPDQVAAQAMDTLLGGVLRRVDAAPARAAASASPAARKRTPGGRSTAGRGNGARA